jgi:hypothetical protein
MQTKTESPSHVGGSAVVRRIGRAMYLALKDAVWLIVLFVAGLLVWMSPIKIVGYCLAIVAALAVAAVGGLCIVLGAYALWLWLCDVWERSRHAPNADISDRR